jgi:sulfite reductase alpha subunit-like flavoprotein
MFTPTSKAVRHPLWAALATIAVAAALTGCGGSSKPSYCSKTADLKKSVQDLGSINILKGGTGALTSALQKVETTANAVVSSAKSDFPSQVDAINSSVNAIKKTAQQLSASPTQPALIAQVPGQISAVASSIQSFTSATSSKCG